MREPVTAYRIAVDNRLFFSYTYKKVVELERRGLLASAATSRGQRVYKATPMGLIALIQREGPPAVFLSPVAESESFSARRMYICLKQLLHGA